MEGRYPTGINLVFVSCKDPSKNDEFNYWYNHMHVPDNTIAGFHNCIRFANTDPASEVAQFVTTYETTFEDVTEAMPALREARAYLGEGGGRGTPWMKEGASWNVFKRLGGEFRAANRPTRGILVVLSNCKDSAREDEFNRWYEDVHIADILDTGAFHTAYRYESLDPERSKAKFLAIYETDNIDPTQQLDKLRAASADWKERGRQSDLLEATVSLTARRLWPAA